MIEYQNPEVQTFEAVGVDLAIQNLQNRFRSEIAWLGNNAYGRALKQETNKLIDGQANSKKLIYYPEVYQSGMEPMTAMPNDNLQAMSFFYLRDPATTIDYQPLQNNFYVYKTSLIVWANLKKIDPTKDFRYTETLKNDILNSLRKDSSVYIQDIYESYENVYSNYTLIEEYRQYNKFPYTAFRIDFDLNVKNLKPC